METASSHILAKPYICCYDFLAYTWSRFSINWTEFGVIIHFIIVSLDMVKIRRVKQIISLTEASDTLLLFSLFCLLRKDDI